MQNRRIFFIGPASVGKTTVGALLADRLQYQFVDIDREFCERIALIPDYVREFGYAQYCEANSALTDALILENSQRTVFATPSGYLVHEESPHLVEKHAKVIKRGISILLLPSRDALDGVDEIVRRQMSRWNDIQPEKERSNFLKRFERYKHYGDIKIYSLEKPDDTTKIVLDKLLALNLLK